MIDLDPEKVLRSPWLWDAKTIEWAEKAVRDADLRARLSLEQRDEPRERGYSMIDSDSGLPTQGELP